MEDDDRLRLSRESDTGPSGESASIESELERLREEVRRLRAALPAPPFVREPAMQDWTTRLPRHPSEQYPSRSMADIRFLVIHHSAVPAHIGPEQIARYQIERHGWPGIGYHYFIDAAGTILKTNPPELICYHTRVGSENSLGICLAGRFDEAPPPPPQLEATAALCAYLCGRLGIHASLGGVIGHGELVEIECPGAQWMQGQRWREHLLEHIRQIQEMEMRRQARAIGHYMLFWQDAATWDEKAWNAATNYIGRFRPVCGFSVEAASHADYVTIVGDEERFPRAVEAYLQEAGCITERIAEQDPDKLRQIFDRMAERNQRFLTIGL